MVRMMIYERTSRIQRAKQQSGTIQNTNDVSTDLYIVYLKYLPSPQKHTNKIFCIVLNQKSKSLIKFQLNSQNLLEEIIHTYV